MWKRGKISFVITFLQVSIYILAILMLDYDPTADASNPIHSYSPALGGLDPSRHSTPRYLTYFQNQQLMPLLGFSIIFAELESDSILSSLGFNLMLFALASQWALFFPHLFIKPWNRIKIGMEQLIYSTRMGLSTCISSGLLHRTLSPIQMIVMVIIEVPLIALLQYYIDQRRVTDVGCGLTVYLFPIYFGLGISAGRRITLKVLAKLSQRKRKKRPNRVSTASISSVLNELTNSTVTSEQQAHSFAVFGAIVVYCLFPNVISSSIQGDRQHRIAITSFLSLSASTLASYALSSLMDHHDRFTVDHIQVGVLSGGVVMTNIGDYMMYPYTALLVGLGIGIISFMAHIYLDPLLGTALKITDNMKLHAAIGLPSLVSGLLGVCMSLFADEAAYGYTLYEMFPARAPPHNSSELEEIQSYLHRITAGEGRSAVHQSAMQLLATVATFTIALIAGLISGATLMTPIFDPIREDGYLHDSGHWVMNKRKRK